VFQCTEAYRIERQARRARRRDVIGNGPTDLHRITMIGNDLALDPASAPAARTARACRSASASRRCGWKITVGGTG
jgi:TldD protein